MCSSTDRTCLVGQEDGLLCLSEWMCDDVAWTHSFIAAFNHLTKPSLRELVQFERSLSNIFIKLVLQSLFEFLISLYVIYVDIWVSFCNLPGRLLVEVFSLAALTDTVNGATLENRSCWGDEKWKTAALFAPSLKKIRRCAELSKVLLEDSFFPSLCNITKRQTHLAH